MSLNQILVIALAILLIWWPIGGWINRRRGEAWLNWLQKGTAELGVSSAPMWLRSFHSVGQLKLSDLREPFQSVDILFTLESRDNLIFWLLRHLRGRRDEMILQAELYHNPRQEIEVGDKIRRSFDGYLAKQKENPFTQVADQNGFRIARRGETDALSIAQLRRFLAAEGMAIQRLSLQRKDAADQSSNSPRQGKNLLLRADMTRMPQDSPAVFFATLRDWVANLDVEKSPVAESKHEEAINQG